MNRIIAFVERDARLALSYPSTLFMPFASIAFSVGGFSILARIVNPHAALDSGARHLDYFSYVVLNLAFMVLVNAAMQCVSAALRRDQVDGTLEPIVATPASLGEIVAASAVWPMCFAALQAAAYLACGFILGMRLVHVNALLLTQFLVLGVACTASIGAIGAAVVIAFKQPPPSAILTGSAATLLTGVLFPVTLLPLPLQAVSWLLPLTHTLRGVRAAMTGAAFSSTVPDALWLAGATILLLPASLVALRYAVARAKNDGSLSAY
jgi:ABC-2 type transport system permease protein